MTHGGMILGTAAYMSPEQAKGKPIDRRADMWAFGCVLFEMLTGTRAFEGEDVSDTLAEILKSEPISRGFRATRLRPSSDCCADVLQRTAKRGCLMPAWRGSRSTRRSQRRSHRPSHLSSCARGVRRVSLPFLSCSVLAAAIGAAVANYLRPEPSRLVRRLAIDLPDLGVSAAGRRWLALSPDGSHWRTSGVSSCISAAWRISMRRRFRGQMVRRVLPFHQTGAGWCFGKTGS